MPDNSDVSWPSRPQRLPLRSAPTDGSARRWSSASLMTRQLARLAAYALIGALVGAIAAAVAFVAHPAMTLDLDRDLAAVTSGFYPVEHANREPFVWSSARADLWLPGF